MDILDDMGVSKISASKFFLKVNYSFKYKKLKQTIITDISITCIRPTFVLLCLTICYLQS